MSTKRTLSELVVPLDDSAHQLIVDAIKKGMIDLQKFAVQMGSGSSANEGEDDEWAEANDDDEGQDNKLPSASAAVGPGDFAHVTHRLIPVHRSLGDSDDDNAEDGESQNNNNNGEKKQEDDGASELMKLQVTTRSPLGAIVYYTHGIHWYNGLVRSLGAGSLSGHMLSCTGATKLMQRQGALVVPQGALVVGIDAFGGVFALSQGGIAGAAPGTMAYLPPDDSDWEALDISYSAWLLEWLPNAARVFTWYSLFSGWQRDVLTLDADEVWNCFPPLWTAEAKTGVLERKAVSVTEILALRWGVAKPHDGEPDAAVVVAAQSKKDGGDVADGGEMH